MPATFPSFVAVTLGVALGLAGLGYWPTIRLAGAGSGGALAAGVGIGLLASWIGTAPVFLANGQIAKNAANLILASTALRSFVALILALAAGLSGWWHPAPLLIWVAVSYIVLLPVDVAFALWRMKRMSNSE